LATCPMLGPFEVTVIVRGVVLPGATSTVLLDPEPIVPPPESRRVAVILSPLSAKNPPFVSVSGTVAVVPEVEIWPTETRRPTTEAAGSNPVKAARTRNTTERIPRALEARKRRIMVAVLII